MFGFDVNAPAPVSAIDQYIGRYSSPEAAQSDTISNAPQGYDYLKKSYQASTGDYFADPFKDASDVHARALTEAAMSGASIATGDVRAGGRLLSLPNPPATTPAPADNAGAPQQDPTLSATGNSQVQNSLMTQLLQGQGNQYQLDRKELQIPDINAPDFNPKTYLDVVHKRANLAGVGMEFRQLMKDNPEAIAGPTADPRFSTDPKTGKTISSDELHPLASDPGFMELSKQDPSKANALYYAVTGQHYQTAINAKISSLVEQRAGRQKILEGIKGIKADPISGALQKTIEVKDFDGTVHQQDLPMSELEKAALAKEGGTERLFGVQLPGLGGVQPKQGMTDEELVSYRQRTQDIMSKNPNLSVGTASQIAHKQLYEEQQAKIKPPPPRKTVNFNPLNRNLARTALSPMMLWPQ